MTVPSDSGADAADLSHLRRAIEMSERARRAGQSPFGAVIVGPGIYCEASNETHLGMPIRHAEIVAIEQVLRTGADHIGDATLYSSCAPCLMCLSTAYYAGIRRVVHALAIADVRQLGSGDPDIEPSEINLRYKLGMSIEGAHLKSAALDVVERTFKERGHL